MTLRYNIKWWKRIPGCAGMYKISSAGEVYSLYRNRLLKPYRTATGYSLVALTTSNGDRKQYGVHRLVAAAFLKGSRRLEVNHIDGNKLNNAVENLEWVTHSDNMKHAYQSGLVVRRGEKHSNSKLTEQDVFAIRKAYEAARATQTDLAKKFGVDQALISRIVRRLIWRHV